MYSDPVHSAPPSAEDGPDALDLDITFLDAHDPDAALISLTDDGCGSTCASPCATAMG